MASGATSAGDDMVVGRTNSSEQRTVYVAKNGDPNGYTSDVMLQAGPGDDILLGAFQGVDAIRGTGTKYQDNGHGVVHFAGNGVVGRGLNGIVGYVHITARNRDLERSNHAGVLGVGDETAGTRSPGVWGVGATGVRGTSANGEGVIGESTTNVGILGRSTNGVAIHGESGGSVGIRGRGSPGVSGWSAGGAGIDGRSNTGVGGIFGSASGSQVQLLPNTCDQLGAPVAATVKAVPVAAGAARPPVQKFASAGELALFQSGGQCSLWLCVKSGVPATGASSKWAQVLLGETFNGWVDILHP